MEEGCRPSPIRTVEPSSASLFELWVKGTVPVTSDSPVHLIDDDEAVRSSLAFLLQNAGIETRTYESARVFLDDLAGKSGCVVTDVRMPDVSGMDLLRRLAAEGNFQVIIITGHGDVPLAVEAMRLGAVDFLEKPFDGEALLAAVRAARVRMSNATEVEAERAHILACLHSLSPREKEVMEGLIAGQSNKAIAFSLGISSRTVEVYRANVMAKMHASSLSALVRMALQANEFRPP